MASEKRLIDANKIPYHQSGFPKGDGFDSGLDWAFREDIDKIPTVDAVEVVLCKECMCCRGVESTENRALECSNPLGLPIITPDTYCAYGERRTNDR